MKDNNSSPSFFRMLSGPRLAFLALVVVAGYFLWQEHRAHILAALPYLVLLICPLMHVFMHGDHHGHHGGGDGGRGENP